MPAALAVVAAVLSAAGVSRLAAVSPFTNPVMVAVRVGLASPKILVLLSAVTSRSAGLTPIVVVPVTEL